MLSTRSLVTLGALCASAGALKIGIINDIHMNPNYNPATSAVNVCEGPASANPAVTVNAPLGRMGCDPPNALVTQMMSLLASENPDLAVVLVPGDLVAHGVAANLGSPNSGNWTLQ